MRFTNILVAVDLQSGDRLAADELSETTRYAIRRAKWLAGHGRECRITFLAVLQLSAEGFEEMQLEEEQAADTVQDAGYAVLDHIVSEARADGLDAHRALAYGRPWEEIVKHVLRNEHDLVVCATRDRSMTSRFFFGGTATKLMRHCPCPVWATKPHEEKEDYVILVASDLGPTGETGLAMAVEAAQLVGAKVHVLHSVERKKDHGLWLTGVPSKGRKAEIESLKSAAEATLHEQLEQTDHRTLPHGVQVHVESGPSETAILDAIEDYHVDLLVMGTIARKGLSGWLVGNTCERLLPQVSCSILALKPEGYVSPIVLDDP